MGWHTLVSRALSGRCALRRRCQQERELNDGRMVAVEKMNPGWFHQPGFVGWILFGGAARNRTGVHGFAIRCVASPPRRRMPPLSSDSSGDGLLFGSSGLRGDL